MDLHGSTAFNITCTVLYKSCTTQYQSTIIFGKDKLLSIIACLSSKISHTVQYLAVSETFLQSIYKTKTNRTVYYGKYCLSDDGTLVIPCRPTLWYALSLVLYGDLL